MTAYVIQGGKAGKERLNLLAQLMLPTTSDLFSRVGVNGGMKCLDVGCGGGHVTLLLADMVGSDGRVVGTDMDRDVLALAREDATAAGANHVEFRQVDAAAEPEEAAYDLVYARFLLTHLKDPEQCLTAMVKACKPEGLIVVEDIDFTGSFCHPPNPAYERYTSLYQQVVHRRGGDPNIGPKLPGMLRDAGLDEVRVNVVQPTHIDEEGKVFAAVTMDRIAGSVISEGLATQHEVAEIIGKLNAAAADPETVMSIPRVFQSWGRRPAIAR